MGFDDPASLLDERRLVEQARVDPGAFALLVRAFVVKVHSLAHRCTGSYDDAEVVTAAVFERAWRALPSFGWSGANLEGWLLRITANEVRSHHRRRPPVRSERVDGLLAQLAADLSNDVDLRVFVELDAHEQREAATRRALATLSADDHEVLALRYLSGLPRHAAAAALGCSRATLDVATVRAMMALRQALRVEGLVGKVEQRGRASARRDLSLLITAAVPAPRAAFVEGMQARLTSLIRAAGRGDVMPDVELAPPPVGAALRRARIVTAGMAAVICLALLAAVATFMPSRPDPAAVGRRTASSAAAATAHPAPVTPQPLRVDVTRSPHGVRVAWVRYVGADFDAYLVLRSDRPARRIEDRGTVTYIERGAQSTSATYAVVVVRGDGAVVAMSEAL